MGLPMLDVAAGIVRNSDGLVLLAQRTERQISAGYWELPGGKIEAGETPAQAAQRELEEEVGIHTAKLRPWVSYEYQFPTRRLRLWFFQTVSWSGLAKAREGQRLAWVNPAQINVAPILPSNEKLLAGLALPADLCLLEATRDTTPASTLARLDMALRHGAKLIVLRAPQMVPGQRIALARRATELSATYGARFVLCGTGIEAARAAAHGVHTSLHQLRPTVGHGGMCGLRSASCQSSEDAMQAAALGADFALMTTALTQEPVIWLQLCPATAGLPLPVYTDNPALAGVT